MFIISMLTFRTVDSDLGRSNCRNLVGHRLPVVIIFVISGMDTSVEYEFVTFDEKYFSKSKWSEFNSTAHRADEITRTYIVNVVFGKLRWQQYS